MDSRMILFDGAEEIIVPEPEPGADFLFFSYLPGLSRTARRTIARSAVTDRGSDGVAGPLSGRDRAYYERRAEAEIEMAGRASDEHAIRSHYMLAGFYLDMIHHGSNGGDQTA